MTVHDDLSNDVANIERQGRRHGWLMLIFGWALAFFMVSFFYRNVLLHQVNPNRLSILTVGDEQLVLKKNAIGHYLVEGYMNGMRTEFLLDTGATQIAVPDTIAVEAGLPRLGGYDVRTASGIVHADRTRIETLQIGAFQFKGLSGVIITEMPGETVLLGMNALGHLHMTQQGDTLTLRIDASSGVVNDLTDI